MRTTKIRAEIKALEKELAQEVVKERLLKNPPRFEVGDKIGNLTIIDRVYKEGCTLLGGLTFFGLWRYNILDIRTSRQRWHVDYSQVDVLEAEIL